MLQMSLNFDGDACWPDLSFGKNANAIHLTEGNPIKIAVLTAGMTSGRPSIAIRIDLPGGPAIVAETSARLLVSIGRLIEAKYPNLLED